MAPVVSSGIQHPSTFGRFCLGFLKHFHECKPVDHCSRQTMSTMIHVLGFSLDGVLPISLLLTLLHTGVQKHKGQASHRHGRLQNLTESFLRVRVEHFPNFTLCGHSNSLLGLTRGYLLISPTRI